MDHDQLKELLPLEALGFLEGEEARAITAHLSEGCDECAAELRSFRETLAAMAMSQAGEGTADHVWKLLEQRLGNASGVGASGADRDIQRPAARRSAIPASRAVSRRWRTATAVAAAAVIVIAIMARDLAYQLASARHDAAEQIAALQGQALDLGRQLADRDRELVSLRNEVATRAQLTQAMLAPDLRTIKLGPLAPAPDAAGLVAISQARGQSLLEVAGLPQPQPDKAYELWWIGAKSGPVRAALFKPGPHGGATIVATMPPAGERILASAITLEPAGGVDKPTGAMYLKGAP